MLRDDGVELLISDAHEGLDAAVAKAFHATWQRCRVHLTRNALAHAGKSGRRVVSAFIASMSAGSPGPQLPAHSLATPRSPAWSARSSSSSPTSGSSSAPATRPRKPSCRWPMIPTSASPCSKADQHCPTGEPDAAVSYTKARATTVLAGGFAVTEVENGERALDVFASAAPFHLLVTDLVMGDAIGASTARATFGSSARTRRSSSSSAIRTRRRSTAVKHTVPVGCDARRRATARVLGEPAD